MVIYNFVRCYKITISRVIFRLCCINVDRGSDSFVLHIDKVYKDGPCKLLIRISIDKLLAEHLLKSGNYRPNRIANISDWKFQSRTILHTHCSKWSYSKKWVSWFTLLKTRKQNTGYCLRATRSIYVYFIYGSSPKCNLSWFREKHCLNS